MGIEPTLEAWEASVLPLNYARDGCDSNATRRARREPFVKVTVNGESRELPAGTTVAQLIEHLQLGGRLAAERNGEIVPRSAHAATALAEGDRIEIVRAIGGG